MKKKKILIAALLVNMVMAVFGTDFEERINEKTWLREYFNEVIYRKDRDIILEYQDSFKVRITDYEPFYDETFWYSSLFMFWDTIECFRLIDNRNVYKIGMDKASFNYKVNKINQNLYEIQIDISGLTGSICIYIWKTEKHCMQHTVLMMSQKKRLCTKQSAPMNLT